MPTAFVTGGSGFVGGALIERLRSEGWDVRALARSERAAARVRELGAEPAMGDLDDRDAMRAGAEGCEVAFHAAAKVEDWGDPADFERLNVRGTQNVIDACREAGVRRLVHVGTEAALMVGQPLINVDESAPLRPDSAALYSSSKAKAEQLVRDAGGLETVVVRPRFVWGRGDTSLLPTIIEMVTLRPLPLDRGRGSAERDDAHRQHRRRPLACGDEGARRQRLLRNRRRAGGVPRIPHASCSRRRG